MKGKGHCSIQLFVILIILVFSILFFMGHASGRTIIVDDDGGADFVQIQDAINASQDGDIIRVYEGTYFEQLRINTSISLLGNGSEQSVIIQEDNLDLLSIEADNVTIDGFTIKHSSLFDLSFSKYGISIHGNNTRILNNNITHNFKGIQVTYDISGLVIENNEINGNLLTGLALYSTADSIIANNSISGSASGVYLWNCTDIRISGNRISQNSYSAISLEDSFNNTISTNVIEENGVGIRLKTTYYKTLTPSSNNSMNNNSIIGNKNSGLNTSKNGGEIADVRFNYWGNTSGPYHPTMNPNATGDNATHNVTFSPWYDDHGNLVYLPIPSDGVKQDRDEDPWILWALSLILAVMVLILIIEVNSPNRR